MGEVTLRWMGRQSSTIPITLQLLGATRADIAAKQKTIEADYPVAAHGTSVGPIVLSTNGQYHCVITLIPAKGGDIRAWAMLRQPGAAK